MEESVEYAVKAILGTGYGEWSVLWRVGSQRRL